MTTHTIRLHRVLRAQADLVYKAFLDADALCKWLPPNGYTAKMHAQDLRVGGTFKMSFTNLVAGHTMGFGGEYLDLKPGELIRYTDVFDDPNLPGTIEVTIKLTAVSCGTDVDIVQAGVPGVIPAEACYLGWQQSLALLALLIEGLDEGGAA